MLNTIMKFKGIKNIKEADFYKNKQLAFTLSTVTLSDLFIDTAMQNKPIKYHQ